MPMNLGKKIAPPRFVMFVVVMMVGLFVAIPPLGWGRGVMTAFDVASALFLMAIWPLHRKGTADQMRQAATDNDANRTVLLGVTGVTMIVILVSVAKELQNKSDPKIIVLVIATLILAWLFSNTIYALHYAHLAYRHPERGCLGLEFPGTKIPVYWDFVYFAFTCGMAFATSDVQITSQHIRKVVTVHCLAAFAFNIGVLAFTINVLGSSS